MRKRRREAAEMPEGGFLQVYDEREAREARETAEVESWTSDVWDQCSVCEDWFEDRELDSSGRCNECRP